MAALIAQQLLTANHGVAGLVVALPMLQLVVSLDAAIEAAWYDHVRGPLDAPTLASVFE